MWGEEERAETWQLVGPATPPKPILPSGTAQKHGRWHTCPCCLLLLFQLPTTFLSSLLGLCFFCPPDPFCVSIFNVGLWSKSRLWLCVGRDWRAGGGREGGRYKVLWQLWRADRVYTLSSRSLEIQIWGKHEDKVKGTSICVQSMTDFVWAVLPDLKLPPEVLI